MTKFSFVVFFLFCILRIAAHPVHVSVTTIEYNAEKKGFVLGFKIFYDDFQLSVYNNYKEELNFEKDNKNSNRLASQYINDSFKISINSKDYNKKMKFVYKEINNEAIWLYYILPFRDNVKQMLLSNNILNELYPDQKNLMIIKVNEFEKGYTLDKNNQQCSVNL